MNAVSHTELTPFSFLERSVRVFPTKPAVVYQTRCWTYREFGEEVDRVAAALTASGVGRGDRVAYLMPNLPEMLVAHYAVPAVGAVLVAINTRLSSDEIAYVLRHSGAVVLVVDADYLDTVATAVDAAATVGEVIVAVDQVAHPDADAAPARVGFTDYRDFRRRAAEATSRTVAVYERDPISINYTSGTTGRPKGVVYSHRGAYLNAFGEVVQSSFGPDTVYLWTLPMFHCNGWCTTWAVTAIGGTRVCLREVRGDAIWREIRCRESLTSMGHPRSSPRSSTPPAPARWIRRSPSPPLAPRPARRRSQRWSGWVSASCTSTVSPRPTVRTACVNRNRRGPVRIPRLALDCRRAKASA
jgi:fatty-acyl-CoA synthase